MSDIIELKEYEPKKFSKERIPEATAKMLWLKYRDKVNVESPSFKTENQWCLTSQGWVGYIPLTPEFRVSLKPKIELANLFRMWEYAYRLDIEFLQDSFDCKSLEEFYERLARILALRIKDRARKGFYRAYIRETERLPYVRGRLDIIRLATKPWDTKLKCHYEEHTADIDDNQILGWTLWRVARSGMCGEEVLYDVRGAYRALKSITTLTPFNPSACVSRLYNRLNYDYEPLHILCRFFLEHSGPSHEVGSDTMLPFLVDMSLLYERFVAEWLRQHLPPELTVDIQEKVWVGSSSSIRFVIDLVIKDTYSNEVLYVLDTKYKEETRPNTDDISQVVTYAEAKGCKEAILIYPKDVVDVFDAPVGQIRVRSLGFALDGDLEEAGQRFLGELLGVSI